MYVVFEGEVVIWFDLGLVFGMGNYEMMWLCIEWLIVLEEGSG